MKEKLNNLKQTIENNIIYKIVRTALYIVVGILLLIIIVQKATNNNLSIGGFRIFSIITGSMKDEYDVGDILVSKHVPVEEINIGDNVTYLGEKGEFKGLIITHKVVEKKQKGNEYFFVTRGTANNVDDPEIRYDQIYGKVVYKMVLFSAIAKLTTNQLTYYILFTFVALVISIEIVSAVFSAKKEMKEEDEGRE